jgi:hypothetical protein
MKWIGMIGVLVMVGMEAFGQVPRVKQWDRRYGGYGDDEVWALHQTTDGGYILGGTSTWD